MTSNRARPRRLDGLHGIGVDKMGNIADRAQSEAGKLLRLENLDVDIPPDGVVESVTAHAASNDDDNSYLPFLGQLELRNAVAQHVSAMTGNVVRYDGESNCIISAGGLSGILNVLLATVEEGDGVLMMEPAYAGLLNRVRLAGGVPKLVPFRFNPGLSWTLDREVLRSVVENPDNRITAMLLMSPCMPTGAHLNAGDWALIARLCVKHDLLVIYDAAMERLLFDGLPVLHPASLPGMAERTVTVGSASKELRMIGWRVGWIVGPQHLMADIGLVSMANVVVPVGIAQRAAKQALEASRTDTRGFSDYIRELQARRDLCMQELAACVPQLRVGKPDGGWSLLVRVDGPPLNWKADEAADALLKQGVCVTPMIGWGSNASDDEAAAQYIRIVFSNEPRDRLQGLGDKVRKALLS